MPSPMTDSSTILAILKPRSISKVVKCKLDILPCRVHHDGPINAYSRYWQPTSENDGTNTAYFRGRKLRGRAVRIPNGYRGAIVLKTDTTLKLPETTSYSCEDDDDDDVKEVKVVDDVAEFEEIVVWNHEVPPEPLENPYFRGIEEWIPFANALHYKSPDSDFDPPAIQSSGPGP